MGVARMADLPRLNVPHFEIISAPTKSTLARVAGPESSASALILGDALSVMSKLPDESMQSVITSPPYWSLRDYGIENQVGLEPSVYDFITALADVFDEVKRVLRKDGTLWLNIGDSYTSGGRDRRAPDKKNSAREMSSRPATPEALKPKDLIGVPWRLAFELQNRGWYLRSDIIWNKPNCQPESVRDRPTRSHEYVFLLSKSEHYKYDVGAIEGPNGRRLRTVWDIKTQAVPEARGHFATYPTTLVEPSVLLSTEVGDIILDPFMGSGTTALVAGNLGRRFLGSELNPEYLNIARRRLVDSGFEEALPFDDLERDAHAATGSGNLDLAANASEIVLHLRLSRQRA